MRTLLASLAKNQVLRAGAGERAAFVLLTQRIALQARAFALLGPPALAQVDRTEPGGRTSRLLSLLGRDVRRHRGIRHCYQDARGEAEVRTASVVDSVPSGNQLPPTAP